MKFQPVVILTVDDLDALQCGALTLQPGQWVRQTGDTHSSRFVGRTNATVWLLWAHGKPTTLSSFQRQRNAVKGR